MVSKNANGLLLDLKYWYSQNRQISDTFEKRTHREAWMLQNTCFFTHRGKGGVKPICKKPCCRFCIFLEDFWQDKNCVKMLRYDRKMVWCVGGLKEKKYLFFTISGRHLIPIFFYYLCRFFFNLLLISVGCKDDKKISISLSTFLILYLLLKRSQLVSRE